MKRNVAKNIAARLMERVEAYHRNPGRLVGMDGVFADIKILEDLTYCDNTGYINGDNSEVTDGFKRYEFKGFDWTVEKLTEEIYMLSKKETIEIRKKVMMKDFV